MASYRQHSYTSKNNYSYINQSSNNNKHYIDTEGNNSTISPSNRENNSVKRLSNLCSRESSAKRSQRIKTEGCLQSNTTKV